MRILKYAIKNIIRNPFLSLSSVFVIWLLIFFVNILLLVLFASNRFIDSVNDRISFTINFQSGYTIDDDRTHGLTDRLRQSFSGIMISSISKDQAFELLRTRNPDLASLIENTGENPLPESLRIDNIPRDQYREFNQIIGESRDMIHYDKDAMERKLLDYTGQFDRISQIVKLLSVLEYWVYTLLGLFVFTVTVIIYSVISNSISFQRQEIEIIELVGGKKSFIYGPFLFQGAIYGLLATWVIGLIIFFLQTSFVTQLLMDPIQEMIQSATKNFRFLFLLEVCIFTFLGVVASLIALKRYIRI